MLTEKIRKLSLAPASPSLRKAATWVLHWDLVSEHRAGPECGNRGASSSLETDGAQASYTQDSSSPRFQMEVAPLGPCITPQLPQRGRTCKGDKGRRGGGAGEGREQMRPRRTLAPGESQQTILRCSPLNIAPSDQLFSPLARAQGSPHCNQCVWHT